MKRLQKYKKIIAFLLVGVILTYNSCVCVVHATSSNPLLDSANELMKLVLTTNGVVARNFGVLAPVNNATQTAIVNEIQNQIGLGGIYEQDGQIYFTSAAMEEIYNILGSSGNARLVSDFSQFTLFAPDEYSAYVNATYVEQVNNLVNSCRNSGKHYLLFNYVTDSTQNADNAHLVDLHVYALLLPDSFGYTAWSNWNNNVNSWKLFTSNGAGYRTSDSDCPTSAHVWVSWKDNVLRNNYSTGFSKIYTLPQTDISIAQNLYAPFPNFVSTFTSGLNTYTCYNSYFCDVPFIISQTGTDANTILNKTNGNYYFNNFESYNISSNTFYNNDWTKIYNSYSTNVVNTYNTEYENNENITNQEIYDIMNRYVTNIYNGIENGDTDIAEKVDFINEWLSKIYDNTNIMIDELDDLITAVTSGGSGCLWTQNEIDSVLNNLSSIYSEQVSTDADVLSALQYLKDRLLAVQNTTDVVNSTLTNINTNSGIIVDSLDMELSRLATIMTKLDTIIDKLGGLNGIDLPSIDPSLSVDLDDILDDDFLDQVFNPFLLASQIISVVVPFCYLFVAVGILNFLKAEPEVPKWKIPIKIDRFNIDTEFEIDLTPYANLAVFIRAFVFMAFGFGLAIGSLNIVKRVLNILA